jgi:transposase
VLSRRVLTRALGVDHGLVRLDRVEEDHGELLIWIRPRVRHRWRCPHCQQRRPGYDQASARRWRTLDFGRTKVYVCSRVPRVSCPDHGVVVAAVPWARHTARHTRAFDDVAAWCAVEMSGSAASRLLRCSWRTIGAIVARVAADLRAGEDDLEGLHRIGIDEISYRRHHRYLLVVVDHDRKRLVYAVDGANKSTLNGFFDALGPERTGKLTHVSADGAPWLNAVISARAPRAVLCADPFHVVRWAMEALDEVRRQSWNESRQQRTRGQRATGEGKRLKDSRWALWKNPDSLTADEQARLTYIAATHPRLHRAWALKEGLRTVFQLHGEPALEALTRWLRWAQRCQIPAFVRLAHRVRNYWRPIAATLTHGLTNALVESVNTKIRLIARRAFGFHNVHALIGLAQLSLGGYRPQLPT